MPQNLSTIRRVSNTVEKKKKKKIPQISDSQTMRCLDVSKHLTVKQTTKQNSTYLHSWLKCYIITHNETTLERQSWLTNTTKRTQYEKKKKNKKLCTVESMCWAHRLPSHPQQREKVSQTDYDTSPASPSEPLKLTLEFTGTACISAEHIASTHSSPARLIMALDGFCAREQVT